MLFQKEKGVKLIYPLPRSVFVDYGFGFIEKNQLSIHSELVISITLESNGFCIVTETGRQMLARHVVVAVGLTNVLYISQHLIRYHGELVSHTIGIHIMRQFCQGSKCLGSGSSFE